MDKMLASGCWLLDAGFWMLASGCWILDTGFWILASGCWMLDAGYLMRVANCGRLRRATARQGLIVARHLSLFTFH